MKRYLAAFLLGAFLLSSWALAEPPAGDAPEPPVRLKKKKKAQPEVPPDKPEVKPEKPEPKPKPKLDEDPQLDPRDDVKLPRNEEDSESDIMRRLTKNARLSEEKLAKRETGEGTRKLQEEVLKDLDRLLEQSKNQQNQQNQQNQDQQNQGGDSKGNQPMGGSADQQPGGQSAKQRAQQRAAQRKQRGGGKQSGQGSQGSGQKGEQQAQKPGQGGNTPGGGASGNPQGKDPKDPDKKYDLWGHLPEKERALMNKEMEQKFMEKYDELTREYYRTIAEKSRRK